MGDIRIQLFPNEWRRLLFYALKDKVLEYHSKTTLELETIHYNDNNDSIDIYLKRVEEKKDG